MDAEEAVRRKSNVEKLREFFYYIPMRWIDARDFEDIAGRQAWRTRISELRVKLEKEGAGTIENRQRRATTMARENGEVVRMYLGGAVLSQYRFMPHKPLGRDAGKPTKALPLLDGLDGGAWQR